MFGRLSAEMDAEADAAAAGPPPAAQLAALRQAVGQRSWFWVALRARFPLLLPVIGLVVLAAAATLAAVLVATWTHDAAPGSSPDHRTPGPPPTTDSTTTTTTQAAGPAGPPPASATVAATAPPGTLAGSPGVPQTTLPGTQAGGTGVPPTTPPATGTSPPAPTIPTTIGSSLTASTVFDADTNVAWAGTETTGASAYDTSSVTASDGVVATGTVAYTFWTNGTCSGAGTGAGTVTLDAAGAVPNSTTAGPLAAGAYSFRAVYSGDSNYGASASACEAFRVAKGSSLTASTVFDTDTNVAWAGTETTGASAYDTSSVTASDGVVATGTVAYTFWTNGTCSGAGTGAGTVTLDAAGAVPNSTTAGPLAAGAYSFRAVYSGDSNYGASSSACEGFSVQAVTSQIVRGGTTCQEFSSGTSSPLTAGHYSLLGGTINGVNPGVFSYYTKIVAPSATFTTSILEANDSGTTPPYPNVAINNGQVTLYDSSCGTVTSGVAVTFPSTGNADLTINAATSGATYIIEVKYSLTSLKGSAVPPKNPLIYFFSTNVNGILVPGTRQSLPFETP